MGPMELLQLQYKGSVLLLALRVRKVRCAYESGKFMHQKKQHFLML